MEERKYQTLLKYSDPKRVQQLAKQKGLGQVLVSTRKDKKYMVKSPSGKLVHFGGWLQEDYTKHKDEKRRANYLKRSGGIKGNWKNDKYSPNNLSRVLLW